MMSLYDMIRDDPNLLLFLPGQDCAGTVVADVSGAGRDGTVNGTATFNGPSPFRFDPHWKSITLANSGSGIQTAYNPFTTGSDRTYELVFNKANHSSNYAIIASLTGRQTLYANTGGDFTWFADSNSVGYNWSSARWTSDGQWGHLILTHHDAVSDSGTAELILDGVSQGSHNPIASLAVTGNINFGSLPGGVAFMAAYSYIMPAQVYKEHALAVVRKRLRVPSRTRLRV